jgi:predicted nucleotidyltransferase component of viral defense system
MSETPRFELSIPPQTRGVKPTYAHEWNASAISEIKLQISRRETPTLPTERRPQLERSYFKLLPFAPAQVVCLTLEEILVEKIRACYQRNKARDIFDLGLSATRPLHQPLIRRLVVLKLWQARDSFDPAELTDQERIVANDRCQREETAAANLREEL